MPVQASSQADNPPAIVSLLNEMKPEKPAPILVKGLGNLPAEVKPEKPDFFIEEELIPKEAQYFSPQFGMDARSGMPYDHVRIRPRKGILGEIGNYTAASKLSLSIPFLLDVARKRHAYRFVKMEPAEAEKLLETSLRTQLAYIADYPAFGGFLPWVDIRPNGKIAPANTKIPSLDNGQLTWALVYVVAVWENSPKPARRRIASLAQKILNSQDYVKFFDPEQKLLFGTIQQTTTGEWVGDKSYYINDMFEGIMAVLWAVLNRQVPEDAWYNLAIPTSDYKTSQGETITTFQGFKASFHEHWATGFLPLMEGPLAPLYKNHLYAQADFARRNGIPGFLSTAYDPRGTYRQMGVPDISMHPVDRADVAVVFATAMANLISPAEGARWLKNLYQFGNLTSKFGAVESLGPDGYADIFTADAKGMTLLSAGGGISGDIKKYLLRKKVPGTDISMYAKWIELMQGKYYQMQQARQNRPVYMPSKPFPGPPPADEAIQVREMPLTDPGERFDITGHLQKGHLHGKNVWSVDQKTLEDDLGPGKILQFEFDIPPYYPYFDQWAFRGTYVDKAVRISDMKYLRVKIPVMSAPMLYEVELKSDDVVLATSVIDTSVAGSSVENGWKTIIHPINPIPESDEKPFNYISIAIHDPRYLAGDYALFGRKGTVQIKTLDLLQNLPPGETAVHKSSDAILKEAAEMIQYWRPSHGDKPIKRPFASNSYQFPGGRGWRGGYMPYTDMSQFRFLRVKMRNLSGNCNCMNIEIKHEDRFQVCYKVPVRLLPDGEWVTLEIKIPEGPSEPLNYFAISDPSGEFEISSISLSNDELKAVPGVIKIHEITKKPARCEFLCSF